MDSFPGSSTKTTWKNVSCPQAVTSITWSPQTTRIHGNKRNCHTCKPPNLIIMLLRLVHTQSDTTAKPYTSQFLKGAWPFAKLKPQELRKNQISVSRSFFTPEFTPTWQWKSNHLKMYFHSKDVAFPANYVSWLKGNRFFSQSYSWRSSNEGWNTPEIAKQKLNSWKTNTRWAPIPVLRWDYNSNN